MKFRILRVNRIAGFPKERAAAARGRELAKPSPKDIVRNPSEIADSAVGPAAERAVAQRACGAGATSIAFNHVKARVAKRCR